MNSKQNSIYTRLYIAIPFYIYTCKQVHIYEGKNILINNLCTKKTWNFIFQF